jgi:uncharacterized membrane protein YccC
MWRPRLSVQDPDRASLRRATRAALVVSTGLAALRGTGADLDTTTFGVFGLIALLLLADFRGSRRERLLAYLATVVLGAVLVGLGTLAGQNPWLGALVMAGVGFVVTFAGVFGGYPAAAQTALLLAFVLAVSVPAAPSATPGRLLGWTAAGLVATAAALGLWPLYQQPALRRRAASACRALAAVVSAGRDGADAGALTGLGAAMRREVDGLRQAYAATLHRPAGPTRANRALAELLSRLGRAAQFLAEPAYAAAGAAGWGPAGTRSAQLASAVADVLGGAAAALSEGVPPPSTDGLVATRAAQRQALDHWAADRLRAGVSAESVLDGLASGHPLRVLSYLVTAIGQDACIVAGVQPRGSAGTGAPSDRRSRPGLPSATLAAWASTSRRVLATVRRHLRPSAIWLRIALRAGLGLGLAVLVIRLADVGHGFWVALGTLSVLRGSANATGRTALQALVGTVSGFLLVAPFLVVVGADPALLWLALPVCLFLTGYIPSGAHFVISQAAFTVLVVTLFNLLAFQGWQVGLVRVEDMALGAAVALLVGALMWPRGARGQLRTALPALYRACARYLRVAFGAVLVPASTEPGSRARAAADAEAERAGEVFDHFLGERSPRQTAQLWADLLVAGQQLVAIGETVDYLATAGYAVRAFRAEAESVRAAADGLTDQLGLVASQLESGRSGEPDPCPDRAAERRAAAVRCLEAWRGRDDPTETASVVGLLSADAWIGELGSVVQRLAVDTARVGPTTRQPWWR